ncbi:MAG: OmpA family protein [Acidobacteriota bacterium]
MTKSTLLALAALALATCLLCALCVKVHRPVIEDDLTTRATEALSSQGFATVDVDMRGRDALLSGMTLTEERRAQAAAVVEDVRGVRVVRNKLLVAPPAPDPTSSRTSRPAPPTPVRPSLSPRLQVRRVGDTMLLAGRVPSASLKGSLAERAGRLPGIDRVVNELSVDSTVTESPWLGRAGQALGLVGDPVNDGGLAIVDRRVTLQGDVGSSADRERLGRAAGRLLSPELTVENALRVVPRRSGGGLDLTRGAGSRASSSGTTGSDATTADPSRAAAGRGTSRGSDATGAATGRATSGRATEDASRATGRGGSSTATGRDDRGRSGSRPGDSTTASGRSGASSSGEAAMAARRAREAARLSVDERSAQQDFDDYLSGRVIEFQTNSSTILASGRRVLDGLIPLLRRHRDARFEISGHTDSRGREGWNRELSRRRAESVRRYLIADGISPDRMTITGHGPDLPIADNDTAEGRRRNRRIELRVLPRS